MTEIEVRAKIGDFLSKAATKGSPLEFGTQINRTFVNKDGILNISIFPGEHRIIFYYQDSEIYKTDDVGEYNSYITTIENLESVSVLEKPNAETAFLNLDLSGDAGER